MILIPSNTLKGLNIKRDGVNNSDNNFEDYNLAIKQSTGDYFIIIDDSFIENSNNLWNLSR